MCKCLRNFTILILSKIQIIINFNGPESQFLSLKYSKIEWCTFFKLHQVNPLTIFDNLHIIYIILSCRYIKLKVWLQFVSWRNCPPRKLVLTVLLISTLLDKKLLSLFGNVWRMKNEVVDKYFDDQLSIEGIPIQTKAREVQQNFLFLQQLKTVHQYSPWTCLHKIYCFWNILNHPFLDLFIIEVMISDT